MPESSKLKSLIRTFDSSRSHKTVVRLRMESNQAELEEETGGCIERAA